MGADVVDDGGESVGGDGASRLKASKWGLGDSREVGSYQFYAWVSVARCIAGKGQRWTYRR